jgi:hypothetical protein
VSDERAGLKQIGTTATAVGDAEAGAAARQREAGKRERREPIVDPDCRAGNFAGGIPCRLILPAAASRVLGPWARVGAPGSIGLSRAQIFQGIFF